MENVIKKIYVYENINNKYSLSEIEEAAYFLEQPFINQCVRNHLNLKSASNDYLQYDAIRGTFKKKMTKHTKQFVRELLKSLKG